MNTRPKQEWNRNSNLDRAANASVLVSGLLIVLFAAATMNTDPAPTATQLAQRDSASRNTLTAQAPQTETAQVRVGGYGDSVRLATAPLAAAAQFKPSNFNGDDHAK